MESSSLGNEDDIKLDFEPAKPLCRCCLSTEKRMLSASTYNTHFMELAGINVRHSDGLPQWLCYECGALLQKAVTFKQKVLKAHNMLYEYVTRCAPFPIDAQDPELAKYATPHLCVTDTLAFDYNGKNKIGYHKLLLHKKHYSKSELDEIEIPIVINKTDENFVKEETGFSDYEDNITLDEYRSTSVKILTQILDDSENVELKQEPNVRKRKKKRDDDGKKVKKKKSSKEPLETIDEPKTSIRKPVELDPTKIRVVTLNPEEQIKQREEESRLGFKFPFKCELCYKGFNFEAKLHNHMSKHSPSRGTFECKLCHMYLPTAYSYSVHSLIHTRRYECLKCGRRMIDRASILTHYRSQHEGLLTLFTCHVCGKISNNSKTHRGHLRNHHGGDRPKCLECGKTFVNKDSLAEHQQIHQGIKNYECSTCGMRFRTRTQIKHHQLKHTDVKDYYCVECDVRFKSSHSLRQHLLKSLKHNENSRQYPCTRCDKRFPSPSAVAHHTLVSHEGVRAHRCTECGAALASRASLHKHARTVHAPIDHAPKPKRHVCDTCGKAFTGKSVLINHVRTHTGEKPFPCVVCARRFTQRTAMRTHYNLVHLKIRRQGKVKPEIPAPPPVVNEPKMELFTKEENQIGFDSWNRQPPPCDVFFRVTAGP